jgi:hypothetical protein
MRPTRFRLAEINRAELVAAIRRAAGTLPFAASASDTGAQVADTAASLLWIASETGTEDRPLTKRE